MNGSKKVGFAVLAALLFVPSVLWAQLPKGFDLQAHRGGRDARPENTLVSFAYAMAVGVTTLEMDMQITKDGVIVIRHDNHLLPFLTKDENGDFLTDNEMPDIRTMKLADLKRFDLGEMSSYAPNGYWKSHGITQKKVLGTRLATLEDVFQLVKDWGNEDVFFNIETKSYCYPVNTLNPDPREWVKKFYSICLLYTSTSPRD